MALNRIELDKILDDDEPTGPFRYDTRFGVIIGGLGKDLDVYDYRGRYLKDAPHTALNRAFMLGRWVERNDSSAEPPVASDIEYQPICKFCMEKADEMVTVHFKHSNQRMCLKCASDPGHRTK